jgi:flagellar biosynthesis protein FliQ
MSPEMVVEIGQEALWVAVLLAAPILLTALAIGLAIGMLQAATQIQEMTLSFIPKLLAVVVVLAVAGHWLIATLTGFVLELYQSIPMLVS